MQPKLSVVMPVWNRAYCIQDAVRSMIDQTFKDWELIVEGAYGAAQHYISVICEQKLGSHLETHKGLIKFLRENDLVELSNFFQQLDELRLGRWYGGKGNGETSKIALDILKKIKGLMQNEE